jgi:hypothetical protein
MNNLQANNLANFGFASKFRLLSEDISLSKKEFKKIASGSWIELDARTINAFLVLNTKAVADVELRVESGYLFVKSSILKKSKKVKNSSSKSSFNLEISCDNLREGKYIIASMPVRVKLLSLGKEFAVAKLYFSGKFYLEIEELL